MKNIQENEKRTIQLTMDEIIAIDDILIIAQCGLPDGEQSDKARWLIHRIKQELSKHF